MKQQTLILRTLLFLYIVVVLYITLLAWNYGASLGPAGPGGRNYNLIPFRSIYRIGVFSPTILDPLRILVGNILLFVPFGFLLPAVWRHLRHALVVVLIGMGFSLMIETSQFLFTHRVANVDDVILNSLGVWIGYGFFYVTLWLKRRIVLFHA
ncbi:VanZ family protein [Halalkalibacter oceani]|uniref:VanZ family protein n=1 Tax=Halalkalibacter oceani TaxID=1653776 RepID=A0A9X2IMV5_9BACI|nr:VanZ family protein [Halalkalibacter oceani]MCM3713405.1 VanZ family protein [Halalkalibacter oceani]